MSSKKNNRLPCSARINGICISMGIPCEDVGNSLCAPIRKAFSFGTRSTDLFNLRELTLKEPVHFYGNCPFCDGMPEILMPSTIERFLFAKGPMVVCSKCKTHLLSVNDGFTSDEIVLHLPATVSERKAALIRDGFTSEQADEIIADGK